MTQRQGKAEKPQGAELGSNSQQPSEHFLGDGRRNQAILKEINPEHEAEAEAPTLRPPGAKI